MVKGNLKVVISVVIIAIALFSGVIYNYTLRKDPTAIKRLSEKEVSEVEVQPSGDNTSTDNADIISSVVSIDSSSSESQKESSSEQSDDESVSSEEPDDSSSEESDSSSESESDSSEDSSDELSDSSDSTDSDDSTDFSDSTDFTDSSNTTDKEKLAMELVELSDIYNKASEKLSEANTALENAKKSRDGIQSEYNKTKEKRDDVKKKYDEGKGKEYNRGLFAFFESVGATDALKLLENSPYSSYLDPSNPNDPSSLESVKRSLELLSEANNLREKEGRNSFRVSYNLMALAVLNNAKTASVGKGQNSTKLAQNVALGYNDPYDAWYYDEKPTNGAHYRYLMNDNYVVVGYGYSNINRRIHNMLFADSDYDSGISVNLVRFNNEFNSFYNSVKISSEYTNLVEQCNKLEKQLNEAKQNVTNKESAVNSAKQECDSAKANYDEKKMEYDSIF